MNPKIHAEIYATSLEGKYKDIWRPFVRIEKQPNRRNYDFVRINFKGEVTGIESVKTIQAGKDYAATLARLSHMRIIIYK